VIALRSGDFNRDGLPDVLVRKSGGLYVMLTQRGKGEGTVSLGSPTAVYTGSTISDVVIADLNGDGVLDIVTCDAGTNTLIILPGKGDGTFDAPWTTSLTFPPRQLVVADFDGDGHPDVLVRTAPTTAFTIFRGGAGLQGFQLTQGPTTALSASPYRAVAADLDGDGKVDLLLGCASPVEYQVLFGKGDGTFETPLTLASGPSFAFDIALADLDGDGLPDIVSCEFDSNTVTVVRNLGRRAFGSPVSTDVHGNSFHTNPTALAVVDANNDGKPDVVTVLANASRAPSGVISTLVGNGDGTFAAPVFFESNLLYVTEAMTAADFTGDGLVDVVTWSAAAPWNYVTLLRSSPTGAPRHRGVHH
jgi:hypothetical protein